MLRWFAFLSLIAAASLASTPFGYMPARAADGSFIFQICSGEKPLDHHPAAATLHDMGAQTHLSSGHADHQNSPSHGSEGTKAEHKVRCDFAVAACADIPKATQSLAFAPIMALRQATVRAPLTGIFPSHLPPSTGPPVH